MTTRTFGIGAFAIFVLAGGSTRVAAQTPTAPPPTPQPTGAVAAAPPVETIHQAAFRGNLEAVKKLLAGDPALVDARNDNGITPLGFAAALGHTEVVKLLVERGADVNARDRQGTTPLFIAVWRNRPEIVRFLLAKGADVSAAGAAGSSLLHVAAMSSQLEVAKALIERRADLGARNGLGNTPLHVAAAFNQEDGMARLLLEAGAQVNATNALDGATPLDVALREGHTAVAELLRSKGGRTSDAAAKPLRGPYLGQVPPGTIPVLFAPNLVSTERSELNAVFSPDGKELYFARSEGEQGQRMRAVAQEGGVWGRSKPVTFVGDYSSVDMFIPRDGTRLYFCSNRALDGKGPAKNDTDIWVSTRTVAGWGEPVNLGERVNSGENDYYPTLTAKGDLYFSSPRAGGKGGNDIYCARLAEGQLGRAENLGSPINTDRWEFDPFIAPDESYLIFSSNRPGGLGDSDLYVSFRGADGGWAPPLNMGAPVNSSRSEYTPMLSPDGKYLFFTSGRAGSEDIYWVDAAVIARFRSR
jgi:ankyrin repeat protein